METITVITTNTKTLELTVEEVHIHFTTGFPYFWLRNDGSSTVQMSLSPNISKGKDGVIEVLAGSSAGTMHGYNATCNDLHILGSGKVQVMGTYSPENPFRNDMKGGDENNEQILLNMPLTTDLSDISGFDSAAEYSGNTPLTIEDNGIFLYSGSLKINGDFLSSITNYTVEFDIKINSTGTAQYPYYRRIMTIGYKSLGVYYEGAYTTNKLTFEMLGGIAYSSISPTKNAYADGNYHHLCVDHDMENRTLSLYIDKKDPIFMRYGTDPNTSTNIYFGDASYGLNGYIKNFVIKV